MPTVSITILDELLITNGIACLFHSLTDLLEYTIRRAAEKSMQASNLLLAKVNFLYEAFGFQQF